MYNVSVFTLESGRFRLNLIVKSYKSLMCCLQENSIITGFGSKNRLRSSVILTSCTATYVREVHLQQGWYVYLEYSSHRSWRHFCGLEYDLDLHDEGHLGVCGHDGTATRIGSSWLPAKPHSPFTATLYRPQAPAARPGRCARSLSPPFSSPLPLWSLQSCPKATRRNRWRNTVYPHRLNFCILSCYGPLQGAIRYQKQSQRHAALSNWPSQFQCALSEAWLVEVSLRCGAQTCD